MDYLSKICVFVSLNRNVFDEYFINYEHWQVIVLDTQDVFCFFFLSFFLAVQTTCRYVEVASYLFTNLSNYDRILNLIDTQASRTEFHNTFIYNSIGNLRSFAYYSLDHGKNGDICSYNLAVYF